MFDIHLYLPKTNFLQDQCEDDCYAPHNYGSLYGYRGYDCSSPCGHGGYRGIYGSGNCYGYPGFYSGRYGYPLGSRYGQRFGSGGCYSY